MLKKRFLATNALYVCVEHKEKILNRYYYEIEKVFKVISDCEKGQSIDEKLEVPLCHSNFQRLN